MVTLTSCSEPADPSPVGSGKAAPHVTVDVTTTNDPGTSSVRPSAPTPETNETPRTRREEPRFEPVAVGDGVRNSIGMVLQPVAAGLYGRVAGIRREGYQALFNDDHANYGGYADEADPHDVLITRPFLVGRHEVTVGQFRAFVDATGHRTTAEASGAGIVGIVSEPEEGRISPFDQRPEFTWRSPGFDQTDEHPVVGVSWDDAQAFCAWLSEKEGTTYRLPTEAEWEYVCRAGTRTFFSWGDTYRDRFHRYANLADRTLEDAHEQAARWQWVLPEARDGFAYTSPVGRFEPSPWGTHDMHGNVWEWCRDVYSDVYYKRFRANGENPTNHAVDPLNLDDPVYEFGDFRVMRGGAFSVAPIQARCGTRGHLERTDATCYVGFRVVREASEADLAEARRVRGLQEAAETTFAALDGAAFKVEGTWYQKEADFDLAINPLPPPEIVAQLPYLVRLQSLRLSCDRRLTPDVLTAIARIPRLRKLHLYNTGADCPPEAYRALADVTGLRELTLTGEPGLRPADLRSFVSVPTLRSLEFGNPSIDDEQLLALRGADFSRLRSLNVRRTTSDGTCLAAFDGAPLVSLHLARLTDAGARQVGRFTRLETLVVGEPSITREGLAQLAGLERLERLDLRNLDQLGDDDFAGLAGMTGLRTLELNGSGAGDRTAAVISNLLLARLSIGSPALTDEGLRSIGNITTLVNDLEIGEAARITDDGLSHLWGPARLRTLLLRTRTGITGRGFEAISDMTQLRRVEIASENLEDVGMRFLGYLPSVTDIVLGHGRHGPKGVTDDGLMLLAEAPNLQRLTLHRTGCPVTDAGIARLRERRPNLQISLRD